MQWWRREGEGVWRGERVQGESGLGGGMSEYTEAVVEGVEGLVGLKWMSCSDISWRVLKER